MGRPSAAKTEAAQRKAGATDAGSGADAKERMIESAIYVLAREGYQGASFSRVLEHSGAPRGSIYYHFPGGKDELIAAAVEAKLAQGLAELDRARGKSLTTLLRMISAYWRGVLERSECAAGCPIAAVSVGATDPELRAVVGSAFARWRASYRTALAEAGVATTRVSELATLLLGGFEGAVQLARAERSLDVYDEVSRALRRAVIERATM